MERQHAYNDTQRVSPVQFMQSGNESQVPVPAVRIYTCGMISIEVLTEIVSSDPPLARYTVLSPQTLRGRGIIPSLTLLKLLLSRPHRFASKDWLAEQIRHEEDAPDVRLDTIASQLRKLLCGNERDSNDDLRVQLVMYVRNGKQSGPGYQLAPYPLIWLDTDALAWHVEQAVRMERFGDDSLPFWERAYALASRGEYLPDEAYSDWAEEKRAAIAGHLRQSIHALARLYPTHFGKAGEEQTLLLLRTYWNTHRTDEDALRPLMELLGQQERYQEALTCVQQAREVLAEEGCELDPRTRDIAEYLRTKQISRAANFTPPAPSVAAHKAPPHGEAPFALALAPMVQLPQTQQTVLIDPLRSAFEAFVPSERGVLHPLASSMQMSSSLLSQNDVATWFGNRVNELKAIGASWSPTTLSYQQHQALIHAEIEKWNAMTDHNSDELRITRRTALATLATLPAALLTKVQLGPLSESIVEDFLRQAATSISTCWHLLNGEGIAQVEYALPTYLPLLVTLAKQPSRQQTTAAYLGSQGCLLMDLVAYHRFHFRQSLAYAQQAVELARIAGNSDISVYALLLLGGAFHLNDQAENMLQTHQEAEQQRHLVGAPLQSYLLAELAFAYAHNGQVQQARNTLAQARDLFPTDFGDAPSFIVADYGLFQLILFEGLTHLALAESDTDHAQEHSKQASDALAQFEKQEAGLLVPQRSKVEIINHQAQAALGLGDFQAFEHYFLAGIQGAKALGSEKRRQEAIANWKAAREQWPYEKRVMELADVLF